MKRFITKWVLCGTMLLGAAWSANAQQPGAKKNDTHRHDARCGTVEFYNELIKNDPSLPAKWKAEGERIAAERERQIANGTLDPSMARTQAGEIIIPVVFHLIGTAAQLNSIPDKDAYDQVEILNRDFNGRKIENYIPTGTLPASMIARNGRAPFRFVLARRNPQGQLTNGIQRVVSNLTIPGSNPTPLKSAAQGGSDAWNTDQYLNIWCGSFTGGLLGIATFPFTTGSGPQGVCIDLRLLGANTCRAYYPEYDGGATLTHEVGHYFYLRHTWSDDGGACGNSDFVTQTGFPLPDSANVNADDTPDEDDSRYGNASGIFRDNCTTGGDGIFYSNYMNYFGDRSLFMFSKGQTARAQACLELYRPSLKSTQGHIPPTPVTDAYVVISSPNGRCDTRTPVAVGAPIIALLRNYGTTTLTSATLTAEIGTGNTPVTFNWTGSLAPYAETNVTIGAVSSIAAGVQNLRVYVSNPNGTTDAFTHNDTSVYLVNVRSNSITAPFTQNFVTPPAGWSITNPDNATTWGYNATIGASTTGSLVINCYAYNANGQYDEVWSPPVDFGTNDSAVLNFKWAYKRYSNETSEHDGLEVLVSGDGGNTFFTVFRKFGADLNSTPGTLTTSAFIPANAGEWANATINLTPYLKLGQKMIIRYRSTNYFGQQLWLDDVSVSAAQVPALDAAAVNIAAPEFLCANTVSPVFTYRNSGRSPITSLIVGYKLDNAAAVTSTVTSTLASSAFGTLNIPAFTNLTPGQHTLIAFVSNPNGTPDANRTNDTFRIVFTVFPTVSAPVKEGFESSVFPPSGWGIRNADNANTWTRTSKAASPAPGDANAAVIKNFGNTLLETQDELRSPVVSYNGSDSVYVAFDVASTTEYYLGGSAFKLDTLSVFVTTDCGNTLNRVYRKFGPELNTIAPNSTTAAEFIPGSANAYRRDSINVTSFLPQGTGTFQVVFRNSNQGDNNIYLDNINISAKTLPARLKEQGFLIVPTVSTGRFNVWQYQNATNLRSISVFNSMGQRVATYNYFNQSAGSFMQIDLSAMASGIYQVQLMFNDRTVTERIIKTNN